MKTIFLKLLKSGAFLIVSLDTVLVLFGAYEFAERVADMIA